MDKKNGQNKNVPTKARMKEKHKGERKKQQNERLKERERIKMNVLTFRSISNLNLYLSKWKSC